MGVCSAKPLSKLKKDLDKVFNDIELTDEELKAAILEGKKRKYFREKHKDHWKDLRDAKIERYVEELDL